MTGNVTTQALVAPLELEGGGFAMLALDQRESLRRMFPVVDGVEVDDTVLRSFKRDAVAALTPYASGLLVDRPLSATTERPEGIAPGCGLILAADVLDQPAGLPVLETSLDALVTPEFIHHVGAVAIKYLVIWRDDEFKAKRGSEVRRFVELAAEAGVASLVEGIVRPPAGNVWASPDDRHAAILAAAEDLSSYGGTIYKAEVPGYVPGDLSRVKAHSERMTEIVGGPWVVLSNGVEQQDFADAVREACDGGASGFLAGRAIWADTVAEGDTLAALEDRSVERLKALTTIVIDANR